MKNEKVICFLVAVVLAFTLAGCREADKVSRNVSLKADNFNVTRKITVINVRDDNILYELVGRCSIQNEGHNELAVISEVAPGEYKKDFIYLSDWVTYVVQDVSGAYVDQYHYEINILPRGIGGVRITMDD